MTTGKTLHVKAGLKAGKIATNHTCSALRARPTSKGGRPRSAPPVRGRFKGAEPAANDNHIPRAAPAR